MTDTIARALAVRARSGAATLPRASFSRIALLGHSFMAEQISWGDASAGATTGKWPAGTTPNEINFTANGWINALQRRIGHRFDYDPSLNKGVGGETSAQILARYEADIRANKDRIDTLFVDMWTNDGPQGLSKEQSWANFLALFAKVREDNLALVTTTISPRPQNSWGAATNANKELWWNGYLWLNQQLREIVRARSSLYPIFLTDPFAALSDPANTGTQSTTYLTNLLATRDTLHPGGMGASLRARIAEIDLAPLIARLPPVALRSMGSIDRFDATLNPNGNAFGNIGFMNASGGTLVNVGGTAPALCRIEQTGGVTAASEVTASIISGGPMGFDAVAGNQLQIAIALAGGKSALTRISLRLNNAFFSNSVSAAALAPGKQLVFSARAKLTGLSGFAGVDASYRYTPASGTNIKGSDGTPQFRNNEAAGASAESIDQTLWLRAPVRAIPPVAQASPSYDFGVNLDFDARGPSAGGLIALSDLSIKAVDAASGT